MRDNSQLATRNSQLATRRPAETPTAEVLVLTPRQALNKAYLKVKPRRDEIALFKTNLTALLDQIREAESEEFHKNIVSRFLSATYYDPKHYLNTKARNDLVIHHGPDAASAVGVIVEAKKPTNRAEMLRPDQFNAKALQELVLYYLRERITHRNLEVKHLVVTNIYEWFIFDAQVFERAFAQNKVLVKQFVDFEEKRLADVRTEFFYKQIAEPAIAAALATKDGLPHTYFDLRDYEKPLRNDDRADDRQLIALFKLLSPPHLLKLPFANDSNSLDRAFYAELLHLIGLTETKNGGKKVIERKPPAERDAGSLLENTIVQLDALGKIDRLDQPRQYGDTPDERLFNVGLELCITWINRILFLKLLEAQLIGYHRGDKSHAFLNHEKIQNFDDLNALFFQVLAWLPADRSDELRQSFGEVPYLNSSLFEPSEIEDRTIVISNLRDERKLPLLPGTVLKDRQGRRRAGELPTLEYLFAFLDAYDFSSEGAEDIQEDNKTLINASVLGLIFEKINGYRDGSFFTPGFVTMYMCRQTLRRAVLQKFNEAAGQIRYQDLVDVYNAIDRDFSKTEANALIDSLRICDPAVGSGHFLVSALNELIALKSELKILLDRAGRSLRDYQVEVVNDELIVTDDNGKLFAYNPQNAESQRVQEALFHQKQTLIESCLFGVDVNPNSVKICRLRLWIELLKNAYYRADAPGLPRALETLPNIDINIKCGNSLISRFGLDADLRPALRKSRFGVEAYQAAVQTYRSASGKAQKREMERLIATIKGDFRTEIGKSDPKLKRRDRLSGELFNLVNQSQLFTPNKTEQKARKKKQEKLERDLVKVEAEIEEIKSNRIYENAFEWRFEFPEVLDDDGTFVGFDLILGNPPYIRQEEFSALKPYLQENFSTYAGTADLLVYFIELGLRLLASKGNFTFIIANKFMRAGFGENLRSWLQQYQIQEIIDFGDLPVFEEATTYPCILSIGKKTPSELFRAATLADLDFDKLENRLQEVAFTSDQTKLETSGWNLADEKTQTLLQKLKSTGKPLGEYVEGKIYRGVLTGLNEAFVIDKTTRDDLIARDARSAEIIKPFLEGKDIKRYQSPVARKWLILFKNGDTQEWFGKLKEEEAWQKIEENYPAIAEWLLPFNKKAVKRSDQGEYWWELRACAYYEEFEKEKIAYAEIASRGQFVLDKVNSLFDTTAYILGSDSEYLMGVLNSKLCTYYFSKIASSVRGGYLRWKRQYMATIPIVDASKSEQETIENPVNQILALKKANPTADTAALEAEIDRLVYALYGLTEAEVAIVEGRATDVV